MTEHDLQSSIFSYVERVLPSLRPYMFAIPNGGWRHITTAIKMKAEGVTPGVYDIFLSVPARHLHGLYIECKVKNNKLTYHQQNFKDRMSKSGYRCEECRSLDDFIYLISNYLELTKTSDEQIISRLNAEEFINKYFKEMTRDSK